MMQNQSSDLIVQFNKGNTKAFSTIYDRYYSSIYYYAMRFVGDEDNVKDIISQTFLKLWKLREGFTSIEKVRSFLYVTTHNACLNFLRDLKQQTTRQKELYYFLQQGEENIFEDDRIEMNEVKAKVIDHISQEIERIPQKYRNILKLFYFDKLSINEIAERLNRSPKTIYTQKDRALKLLRTTILKNKLIIIASLVSFLLTLLLHSVCRLILLL